MTQDQETAAQIPREAALLEARVLVERRRRMRVVLTVIPGLIGLLIGLWSWGLNDEYFRYAVGLQKELVLLISVSLLGLSGLSAVMTYLQTGFVRNDARELELELVRRTQVVAQRQEIDSNDAIKRFEHDLAAIRDQIASRSSNPNVLLGEDERRRLVDELRLRLTQEAGTSVLNDIRAETASALAREAEERGASEHFQDSRARLLKELEALGRRGNLNLALGAMTTVVGIALLGVSVFSELTTTKDTWSFLSHFVPRLTLVVLIELFAYFFLSLYKTSLNEIKYFQNELTNIEAKQVALRAAFQANANDAVVQILGALAVTERNHVLTKEQTTVELEKAKIEKDSRNEFAKYLAEFFQKKG